jgi:hypothetical protein
MTTPAARADTPGFAASRLPTRDRANPGSASLRITPEMSGKCRFPDRSSERLSARPAGAGRRD